MAVTTQDIRRVRRMTAESTDAIYNDVAIASYIEAWPVIDNEGRSSDEDNWTEGYDLHAAAADIWEEKAAARSDKHDFSADGANYSSSQMYNNAMEKARYHRARQKAKVKVVAKRPLENTNDLLYLGIHANIDPPGEDDMDSFIELWG